ncbi:MAG: hypothetical protein KC422_25285 [Trueperaceae bacterium]|nr:hypothetical protein [Trueperaceae bacterium]
MLKRSQPDYNTGRRFFHEVTRQYDPLDPYTVGQKKLLQILGFSAQASVNVLEFAKGDIYNLIGKDFDAVLALDGMGEAHAAKLIALFAMIHEYEKHKQTQKIGNA